MSNETPKKKRDAIVDLIPKLRGNVSAISRKLKITRTTLNNLINDDVELKQLLADERERMVDNAEEGLNKAINGGEAWAVCFALKTQGQNRGYIEKQKIEHTGKDGNPIESKIIVEIVNGREKNSN